MAKVAIFDEDLDNVTGGKITYTWDGSVGTIGINGKNPYILLDKNAFGAYYAKVKDEKSETQILKDLLAKGIIKKP